MNINELYKNTEFNNLLSSLANKKSIVDFDDFRQDVFLEILDDGRLTDKDFKASANRVAKRYYKSQFEDTIFNGSCDIE